MSHPPEEKAKACKMYQEGIRPSCISEITGIPTSTIYDWTREGMGKPPELFTFACPTCGELALRKHLNRKYCSDNCKSQAKNLRSKAESVSVKCKGRDCYKKFTKRTNKQYCSRLCKDRAAKRKERERNNQNDVQSITSDSISTRAELIDYIEKDS